MYCVIARDLIFEAVIDCDNRVDPSNNGMIEPVRWLFSRLISPAGAGLL